MIIFKVQDNDSKESGMKISNTKALLNRLLVSLALVTACFVGLSSSAEAATCFTCHAPVGSTTDIRPVESTYRNYSTGSIKGSHLKHIPAITTAASSCVPCHTGASGYSANHSILSGNMIQLPNVGYLKGASFSQNGNPVLTTCTTAICHSSAYSTAYVTSPTWGNASNCLGCHTGDGAFTGTGSSPNTGSHTKHLAKGSVCGSCHTGASPTSGGNAHIDGNIDVVAGGYSVPNVTKHTQGTYTGTCATASCHVSAYGTDLRPSTVWGVADCAACHSGLGAFTGTGSAPNTGSHNLHGATAATCSTCHAGAVKGLSGGNAHINQKIEVTGMGYSFTNITKHAPGGYGKCSSSVCHADPYSTNSAISPTWGVVTGCASCHNGVGAFIGSGSSPNTGSHTKHMLVVLPVQGATTCGSCHLGATASTGGAGHANNSVDLLGYATATVSKHAPTSGYKTCTNAACHVSVYSTASVPSPTWGVSSACGECHVGIGAFTGGGSAPITGSHTKHMALNLPVTGQVNCASCHAGAVYGTSGGNNHIDGTIDVTGYITPNVVKHAPNTTFQTCTTAACHVNPYGAAPIPSPTWGVVILCGECHTGIGALTGTGSAPITGSHTKHMLLNLPVTGQVTCATCHVGTVRGTTGGTNHIDGDIDVIGYRTPNVVKHAANTTFTTCTTAACHVNPYGPAPITSPTWGIVIACGECHVGVGAFAGTGSSPTTGSHTKHQAAGYTCNSCHTGVTAGSTGGPAHIDGNVDVIAGMYYANNVTKHAAGGGYGVCNNASCHTNSYGTAPVVTPSWGAPGPGCANCHVGVGAFTGTGSSPITGSHIIHTNAGNACANCHMGAIAGVTGGPTTAHRDGNIDVGGGSGYPLNITKHLAVTGYSTCSTSSCHISPYGTVSVVTPSWGTNTASHCVGCHVGVGAFTGAGSGPTTGSHSKHLKANPLCANCHTGAVAGTTGGPAGIHKDTNIDVIGGYTLNVPKHLSTIPSTSTDRCNSAICHANVYGTALLQTPTWGNAVGCVACHTGVGAFTGISSAPNTGSHTRHIAVNPLCSNCHAGASSGNTGSGGSAHTDGNIDIIVGMGYPTNLTKHTVALGFRCSTASCHSSPYGVASITTPTWGTLGSCGSCHTGVGEFSSSSYPTTGSHTKHIAAANAALPPNQGCSACHAGAVAASSGGNAHTDGNVDVTGGYSNTANVTKHNVGTGYGSCSTAICHSSPYGTSVAAGSSPIWGQAGSCVNCHNGVGSFTGTGSTPATGRHTQHMSVDLGKPATCTSCHDGAVSGVNGGLAHIDGNIDVTFVGYTPNVTRHPAGTYTGTCNVSCHGSALQSNTLVGYPGTPSGSLTLPAWNAPFLDGLPSIAGNGTSTWGTGDCAKCHGFPPRTPTHAGQPATACIGCHPTVSAAGTSFTSPATHVDGTVNSSSSCISCHAKVQVARVDVMKQFTSASNSHHYQGGTKINNVVCYACHWEADSLGATTTYHGKSGIADVDLVIWNATTRPATYTANVTASTYRSGGAAASTRAELLKINSHCLGCHNDANKNIQPFANDTNTPSTYSWEALSTVNGGFGAAQSIGAKYSATTTTAWGKFAGNFTNNKNQVKAFSAHNNTQNQRGWSTLVENLQNSVAVANYPNTSGTVAVLCFDCHNSHGSAANTPTAITSSYNSATGTKRGAILKQTIAGQGGYTMTYTPGNAGSVAEKNQHNAGAGICFDCHNNSAASTATLSGSTTPWGYTATFGASQVIHGYNDTPYFGKTGGTFAKTQIYTYTAGTAGAMNVNRGGHFGASSTLINAAGMQIGGLCTPCHDPHGVSPGISTPANSVPLLKGTYVTSPYKVDVAGPIVARGGGSNQPVIAGGAATAGFVPGYHIDQNTMQAGRTMKPANAGSWLFATSAKSLQTMNSTQFGGLCQKCHTQATLNSTAAASSANWKSSGRIHNSVAGWASAAGGNVNNTKHAFTCSKCHATHNSRLPRLLVTNCLDVKHAGRVISQGTVPRSTSLYISPRSATTSGGRGRFPGGGGGLGGVNTATNPGPWYFGNTSVGTAVPTAATTCHQSATAGGTTFNPASQYWNTKSLW